MVTFRINGTDYADHIIAGTYAVNIKDITKEWTDSNRTKHRRLLAKKVQGSFEMFFRTEDEFNAFRTEVETEKALTGRVNVIVSINGILVPKAISTYLDFEVTRNIDGNRNDYYQRFTVNLEEA